MSNQVANPGFARPAYSSSIGVAGAEPARESHVPEEIALLRQATTTLSGEMDSLCARVAAVSSPMLEPANGEAPPDTYRVPVAEEIRTERRRIQGVIELIRRLSMAIEL